jgi:hypothetical protein
MKSLLKVKEYILHFIFEMKKRKILSKTNYSLRTEPEN